MQIKSCIIGVHVLKGDWYLSVCLSPHFNILDALENGHSITELISHGFDLLTLLLPQSANTEELRWLHFINYKQISRFIPFCLLSVILVQPFCN